MSRLNPSAQKQFDALDSKQRALFCTSGVFAPLGRFSAAALLAVFYDDFNLIPAPEQVAGVAALRPALLNFQEGFYSFPNEAIHAHALGHLETARTFHLRHLRYYQTRAESWSSEPHADVVDSEVEQYAHAFGWARENAPEALLTFLLAGCRHLPRRFRPQLTEWLAAALTLLEEKGEKWGAAETLRELGDASTEAGCFDAAHAFYYAALTRYGESSLAGQAHTFRGLGDLAIREQDFSAARDVYYKALVLYEVVDFKLGQANCLKQLGMICADLRDYKHANEFLRRALAHYVEMDFDLEQAECLRHLGDLYARQQELEAARENYTQALFLYEAIDFAVEQAFTLVDLGEVHLQAGDKPGAQQCFDRALPIFERMGERFGQAQTLRALGNVRLLDENLPAAIEAFDAAFHHYRQINAYAEAVEVGGLLAHLYTDAGQAQEAVLTMLECLTVLTAGEDVLGAHEVQGRLRAAAGKIGEPFFPLWVQLSGGIDLPLWLHPDLAEENVAVPPELRQALESPAALRAALSEKGIGLLYLLGHLPVEERAAWLEQALAYCASGEQDGLTHRMRAWLHKELAGLPGQAVHERLEAAVRAFDAALEAQADDPQAYAVTQNQRVMLLRDMAGMAGQDRAKLLYMGLEGINAALEKARPFPAEYTATQLIRAHVLRELAGLRGEDRASRMAQAMAAYDELLELLAGSPLELATVQTNRASLLQEIALLGGEDHDERLRQAVAAAAAALRYAEGSAYERVVQHMIANLRQNILATHDAATFDGWWAQVND